MSKKNQTQVPLKPLDAIFGESSPVIQSEIQEIELSKLHTFHDHPFKVLDDEKMEELVESIKTYGVLMPAIAKLKDGGYELISGHRRKRACELAGLNTMPVLVKEMSDDEATVVMVDSNIQREQLLPSEKAFAYKMKYDALKKQGFRTDLTSCQVDNKSAIEVVQEGTADSKRQILRYIHLTLLISDFMNMTDTKHIPFNTAVEVSYLTTEEQETLQEYMQQHNIVPSLKQVQEMKKVSKTSGLTYQSVDQICSKKKKEKRKVQITEKELQAYFPEDYTEEQMKNIIHQLLGDWVKKKKED